MFFKSKKYEKYAQEACKDLQNIQSDFKKKYDLDSYENWFYNQSTGLLRLYNEDKEIHFKYIPVGTFSRKSNSWLWAWANDDSNETEKFQTLKVKAFGEQKKYDKLSKSYFDGDEYTGWELTSISFGLLGGLVTYRVVSDDLEKYFILTDIVNKTEVDTIESELIDCSVHGKSRTAFLCQHLNAKEKTGFEEAFDTYRGIKLDEDDDL